jgi:1-acyl-sn-glycerol-3-phosphate acyltransferase
MSVVIFPEGTRTPDGQMGKFKRGAFLISEELQLPILPVTIDGNYDVMSRHAWNVTWHPVHMTIHEPVWPKSTKDMTEAEVKEIMNETSEKVYNTIKETLDKGN